MARVDRGVTGVNNPGVIGVTDRHSMS